MDGAVVAVDAGGSKDAGKKAGKHGPQILVLSHDDKDHIQGAVELISAATGFLRELWVPVEWAILLRVVNETRRGSLLPESQESVSVSVVEEMIAAQVLEENSASADNSFPANFLGQTSEIMDSWDNVQFTDPDGFSIIDENGEDTNWYGAKNLKEIIRRVKRRAKALIAIFETAKTHSVILRFFSIDLALSTASRSWETQGQAGTATVINGKETPLPLAVTIPPGLPNVYALTRVTVQNRRALSTLLWGDNNHSYPGGTTIWSDTDGQWLDHFSPLGLDRVVQGLAASSAPHHASANPAHDRVWQELRAAPSSMVMISAGGNRTQQYRSDYNNLGQQRSCTWCRTTQSTYQEVSAQYVSTHLAVLQNQCLGAH
ncbi:hypothetical protein [Mycetocola sp. JXN-3]|uniref:hypothetical protein n=1 Tax=Mycetocola sp. JXN-3 TaxID=2116510 RepID=UPI001CAA86B5|nr:hypothetical protein [Mycetocola sp. JXN-3]